MTRPITTRPTLNLPIPAIVSSAIVLAFILAGGWIITYGLPTGETASWWVFIIASLLLLAALLAWRYLDLRRMSLLQRSLIVSVLIHVLIAAAFSGVTVARQVARIIRQQEPMAPAINLNLAQEIIVRTQLRQQIPSTSTPPIANPSLTPQPLLDSPLPPLTTRLEPVGSPDLEPRQIASAQNPIAPISRSIPLSSHSTESGPV